MQAALDSLVVAGMNSKAVGSGDHSQAKADNDRLMDALRVQSFLEDAKSLQGTAKTEKDKEMIAELQMLVNEIQTL